jgi:hypothetical protein
VARLAALLVLAAAALLGFPRTVSWSAPLQQIYIYIYIYIHRRWNPGSPVQHPEISHPRDGCEHRDESNFLPISIPVGDIRQGDCSHRVRLLPKAYNVRIHSPGLPHGSEEARRRLGGHSMGAPAVQGEPALPVQERREADCEHDVRVMQYLNLILRAEQRLPQPEPARSDGPASPQSNGMSSRPAWSWPAMDRRGRLPT